MVDMLKAITQIEEQRNRLHVLLNKNGDINTGKPLAVSRELDEIIAQYYETNKIKNSGPICMICNSKMHMKSG